jgi:hypothetical protein
MAKASKISGPLNLSANIAEKLVGVGFFKCSTDKKKSIINGVEESNVYL